MIHFVNPDFQSLCEKEWIVSNGLGGYASGSLSGANTRRYHGLLVAALNPPTQRMVLVSKVEETVAVDGAEFELSANQFPQAVNPKGYSYLNSFERFPFPKSTYKGEGFSLSKSIFMVHGENTTAVTYKNEGRNPLTLRVAIFLNHRDYHGNMRENQHTNFYTESQPGFLKTFAHYGANPLYTKHEGTFEAQSIWYKNYVYEKEQSRGLDSIEDIFRIGQVELHLEAGEASSLFFSTEETVLQADAAVLRSAEMQRYKQLRTGDNDFLNDLLVAGDQFVVERKSTESHSIIAGYHWFTDWGRDSMIAMRGLCIDTNRQDVCKSILKTFLNYLDAGMLPNRFPDAPEDEIEYNTIDATLWLFVVLYEYDQKFKDDALIRSAFGKLTQIIHYHKTQTRYNIHETSEGFIYGGEGISQLTWMDARIDDVVVTPRHGCPVEIQALWYNALKTYQYFQQKLDLEKDAIDSVNDSLDRFQTHFVPFFFNDKGYLNDVIVPNSYSDDALRCNQIYAVSLPFSILNSEQQKQVVDCVTEKLLTPFGLRTLEPDHPDFKPSYGGDVWSRDLAYHQGTVWPFLISEYVAAYLKVNELNLKSKAHIESILGDLENHFYNEACIGGISEVFDGLNPKQGKGTIQQAWSVSALIRILYLIQKT